LASDAGREVKGETKAAEPVAARRDKSGRHTIA
jgi:hypothetical protein